MRAIARISSGTTSIKVNLVRLIGAGSRNASDASAVTSGWIVVQHQNHPDKPPTSRENRAVHRRQEAVQSKDDNKRVESRSKLHSKNEPKRKN